MSAQLRDINEAGFISKFCCPAGLVVQVLLLSNPQGCFWSHYRSSREAGERDPPCCLRLRVYRAPVQSGSVLYINMDVTEVTAFAWCPGGSVPGTFPSKQPPLWVSSGGFSRRWPDDPRCLLLDSACHRLFLCHRPLTKAFGFSELLVLTGQWDSGPQPDPGSCEPS